MAEPIGLHPLHDVLDRIASTLDRNTKILEANAELARKDFELRSQQFEFSKAETERAREAQEQMQRIITAPFTNGFPGVPQPAGAPVRPREIEGTSAAYPGGRPSRRPRHPREQEEPAQP